MTCVVEPALYICFSPRCFERALVARHAHWALWFHRRSMTDVGFRRSQRDGKGTETSSLPRSGNGPARDQVRYTHVGSEEQDVPSAFVLEFRTRTSAPPIGLIPFVSSGPSGEVPSFLMDATPHRGSPFVRHRDKVGAMARENSEQSWALGMVRFIFYVAIAIAVGYAIVRFWPAYYWPH